MSATLKLDRNKPYAEVHGTEINASYIQDGFHFDFHGNLVEEHLTPDLKARLDKMSRTSKAKAAAQAAFQKVLEGEGVDPATAQQQSQVQVQTPEELQQAAADAEANAGVDLVAWAKGEKQYIWMNVQKAARETLKFSPSNKKALLDFMVEEAKIITSDQIKV